MGSLMEFITGKRILIIGLICLLGTLPLFPQGANDLVRANDLFLAGKYAEAKAIVEPILEEDPEYTAAIFLLGKICFKLGNLDKARELIDKAIEKDLGNQEYRDARNEMATFASKLTEASRLYNNSDYEGARKVYQEIIKENPNFVNAYIDLGRVCVRLGDLQTAAENFKTAIEMDPENENFRKEFESLTRRFIQEGTQLIQRKSYPAALEKFKQAASLNPEDPMAHYFMAVVYLEEGDAASALLSVNRSIELDPEYPKAHLVKGKVLTSMNDIAGAINSLKRAVEIDPQYIDAWKNIGYIYYKTKQYDLAIPAYKEVTKLEPRYASAYANMGAIYLEQKKYSEAVSSLSKAVEFNPRDVASMYRLSQAYNNVGKCEQAKATAQNALKIRPNWAPVLIELGIAERCVGNRTAARQAFQLATRDPKWKAVAEYELKTVQ